jgi:hypothetical protein
MFVRSAAGSHLVPNVDIARRKQSALVVLFCELADDTHEAGKQDHTGPGGNTQSKTPT